MAASRVTKLIVCAYKPDGEQYPVLLLRTECPPNRHFGQYASPVIRRADLGYMDLLRVCKYKPRWLYGQTPVPLQ